MSLVCKLRFITTAAHIQADFPWCELLQHTKHRVTHSVLRGVGPARQSCSFDFKKLCLLPRLRVAVADNGPRKPVRLALLSCLFLREVEAGMANLSAWTFDTDSLELSCLMPSSKCYHMALGVTQSWACLCDLHGFACPYHLADEHRDWLRGLPEYDIGSDMPLFSNLAGPHPEKASVVATFECLGTCIGQPLVSEAGQLLFGGHNPRVTGAQTWAAIGIEITKIRILARHFG